MERVHTGSRVLDAALAGGLAPGTSLFLAGEEGAGATEFALTLLHATVAAGNRRARFASALRSSGRIKEELMNLFADGSEGTIDVRMLRGALAGAEAEKILDEMGPGDVLVLESADSLAQPGDGWSLTPLWHELADKAHERGVVICLLHAPGTLPPAIEASLAEGADGVMRFSWQDGGPTRRRILSIAKLRGLAPILGGDKVPLFEVALEQGRGYTISVEHSVV